MILCDRFLDSTVAYQGSLDSISLSDIYQMARILGCDKINPDITIFLDIDPQKSIKRFSDFPEDRFTKRGIFYLQKVRKSYLDIMRLHPNRVYKVDGDMDRNIVSQKIKDIVCAHTRFLAQ